MEADLWSKSEITSNRIEIRNVFEKSYGEKIDAKKFRQIYECNPFGETKAVALKYDQKLVGYYGIVPQKLTLEADEKNEHKSYALGTSLMVLPQFRGMTALSKIMEKVDNHLKGSDFEFLIGFPNEESFTPLSRLLGWKVIISTRFFEYDLPNSTTPKKEVYEGYKDVKASGWSVPYGDKKFIEWKGMCENYKFARIERSTVVVYKQLDNKRIDIVDVFGQNNSVSPKECLKSIGHCEGKNKAIITGHHAEAIGLDRNKLSIFNNQNVRLCSPNKDTIPDNLSFSLLMSDVF